MPSEYSGSENGSRVKGASIALHMPEYIYQNLAVVAIDGRPLQLLLIRLSNVLPKRFTYVHRHNG